MDWETLRSTLSERNALVEKAINETEAGLADGCELIYNPAAIDADAGPLYAISMIFPLKDLLN
jgi:hypothetical protein